MTLILAVIFWTRIFIDQIQKTDKSLQIEMRVSMWFFFNLYGFEYFGVAYGYALFKSISVYFEVILDHADSSSLSILLVVLNI